MLRALAAAGETLAVEFKGESRERLSDADLLDGVVCLSNRPGGAGVLLVGVENDGAITGSRPRHGERTEARLVEAFLANNTSPSLSCRVSVVPVGEVEVLVVEVPSSERPVGTLQGRYIRRTLGGTGEPECVPYLFPEMATRTAGPDQDFSASLVGGAVWEDLDPLEFEHVRRLISESQGRGDANLGLLTDLELCKALGVVEVDGEAVGIRVAALLLLGREGALRRLMPTHEVALQTLEGTQVVSNEFLRWPLLRTTEEAIAYFRARSREEELVVGMRRYALPEYSELAFREAVANAVVHRDYRRLGAIHIQWHADRVEISSPGGFPEGVRLDNLLVTQPRPRNPLLADVFKRIGLVERTGRGIDAIYFEQVRHGRPAPSYERSSQAAVVLVMPGGAANMDFVRSAVEQSESGHPLSLEELLVLNRLWLERRVTLQDAAAVTQRPDGEVRAICEGLVERGLVEATGDGGGRAYQLSASTYRAIGDEAGYVRAHGFEPLQHEQMILTYIRAYGRITRGSAAGLCRIDPRAARTLLARLVREGKLELVGSRRNASYRLPNV
jgi:ATP-dependent DNA helicase RecG